MGKHKPILIHPTGCTSKLRVDTLLHSKKIHSTIRQVVDSTCQSGKNINPVKPKRKTKWLGIVALVHLHTLTPRATREAFE